MERLVPRAGITQISPYRPGRPSDSGRPFLNLSLSQNALGPGSQALAAYRQAAAAIHQYPDPEAGALRTAIADRYGLERDHILCSNGSDEMIQLIALAYAGPGDEVLFPRYAYHGFAHAARVAGATPVVATDRDLTADIEALADRAGERTRIVFLANPNNPTGSYLPIDTVHQLRRALPPHTLLVLDAAYAEYVRCPNYEPGIELVDAYDNVVMVRSFSKIHGLAGLRIGWAYAPPAVIESINRVRSPFNVATPAQAAAVAALGDAAHVEATLAHTETGLSWLSHALEAIGLRVYPSVCNFVLARIPPDPALGVAQIRDHLWRHHIAVKILTGYGLTDSLRITVGLEPENRALVTALGEILS